MTALGLAVALMLIIEGLLPLAAPARWRELFRRLLELNDGQIRFLGLAAVGTGVALLLLLS